MITFLLKNTTDIVLKTREKGDQRACVDQQLFTWIVTMATGTLPGLATRVSYFDEVTLHCDATYHFESKWEGTDLEVHEMDKR